MRVAKKGGEARAGEGLGVEGAVYREGACSKQEKRTLE